MPPQVSVSDLYLACVAVLLGKVLQMSTLPRILPPLRGMVLVHFQTVLPFGLQETVG